MTCYHEWDIETVSIESGDILDHCHADKLKDLLQYKNTDPGTGKYYFLVLVRDTWHHDTLEGRTHAYESNGEFPLVFENGVVVPKRLKKEYEKIWKIGRVN